MILAAAACAAAGISYIFNDDEQSTNPTSETVTASSTIIDKQGIIKYVIYPRMIHPYLFLNHEEKNIISVINKSKSNQFEIPIEINQQKNHFNFKEDFSVVFFWSIPLKSRLLKIPTKSSLTINNLNPFQRHLMKISIGTQNGNISPIPSEIALSDSDHTLDSLSYNPTINDHITPIGILKKTKLDLNKRENNQKRFCIDQNLHKENILRNIILENVNLCVENLSKILSESCSSTQDQLTTLPNSPSLNNNQSSITQNIHSKFFQHEENHTDFIERLSDGIILHRGKQFGLSLGEPLIRKSHENSFHSIYKLNRLLSKRTCLLMEEYQIKSIEDLIRLYLEHGQEEFTELMINFFKVDRFIVEQLNLILQKWSKQLTEKYF